MLNKKSLLIFVGGLVIGALVSYNFAPMHRWHRKPNIEKIIQKLSKELDLKDNQKDSFRKVLQNSAAQIESMHRESAAKFEKVKNDTRTEMRKILDAEQQQKYDKIVERWEKRRPPFPKD